MGLKEVVIDGVKYVPASELESANVLLRGAEERSQIILKRFHEACDELQLLKKQTDGANRRTCTHPPGCKNCNWCGWKAGRNVCENCGVDWTGLTKHTCTMPDGRFWAQTDEILETQHQPYSSSAPTGFRFTGEYRAPHKGEWFKSANGNPLFASADFHGNDPWPILKKDEVRAGHWCQICSVVETEKQGDICGKCRERMREDAAKVVCKLEPGWKKWNPLPLIDRLQNIIDVPAGYRANGEYRAPKPGELYLSDRGVAECKLPGALPVWIVLKSKP